MNTRTSLAPVLTRRPKQRVKPIPFRTSRFGCRTSELYQAKLLRSETMEQELAHPFTRLVDCNLYFLGQSGDLANLQLGTVRPWKEPRGFECRFYEITTFRIV